MIKVFDTTKEFETYSAGGLKSGELCYVAEDKTAHFRTNNIDGTDQTYNMSEGEGNDEPEYTELNLNTFTVDSSGKKFSIMITATVGQTIEIYNPNHINFNVGQGQPNINIVDGEQYGYEIYQNGFSSLNVFSNLSEPLEHLYVTNAPNTMEGGYSEYGFCIEYSSQAGTPINGVIYYRIID